MTPTSARRPSPWTTRRTSGAVGTTVRPRTAAATLVAALLVLLPGCGQGTGGAGPAGAAAEAPTQAPTEASNEGDGMDGTSSRPTDDGAGEASGLPVPSGLPGGGPLPADPAGAELVLVAGPPGAQQPPVTLFCDWVAGTSGGTHPQAEQACTDLRAALGSGDPFAPVAPDAMCTQQYGGDAVVEVTGAVLAADGGPVDVASVFTLTDGCQIARFEATGALLSPYRGSV